MKRAIAALALGMLGVGVLAGCATTQEDAVVTKESLYGFQAATAVSLLTDTDLEAIAPAITEVKMEADSETDPGDEVDEVPSEEEELLDINQYIVIMEQLLSDEEAPIVVASQTSDREEYAYKLVVTTNYLTGESASYILYYNELTEEEIDEATSSEIVTDSEETSLPDSEPLARRGEDNNQGNNGNGGNQNDWRNSANGTGGYNETDPINERGRDSDRADHDQFLGEGGLGELNQTRDEYHNHENCGLGERNLDGELINLEGIIVIDEVEYALVGTQGENATSFFVSLNETNWIRMVQVVNDNVTKYMINTSIDGVMSRVAFKAQIEEDSFKVSLFILNNGEVTSYSFRKMTRNDVEVIMIRIIEGDTVTHVIAYPSLDEVTGEVIYTYEFFESGHGYGYRGHHHH
jgi:hypothetical protein